MRKRQFLKQTAAEMNVQPQPMSQMEISLVADALSEAYRMRVHYYKKAEVALEEAHQRAAEPLSPEDIAELKQKPCRDLSWFDLQLVVDTNPQEALWFCQNISEVARQLFEHGVFAGETVKQDTPFERAQFAVVREAFLDEWQPRGGIEQAMIDMLAQTFFSYQFWLKKTYLITSYQHNVIEEDAAHERKWELPRQKYVDLLEHATQMADRYNRMFLRILRQMRDLRRYNVPVTINNPQQVNIAADGGQQVNVAEKKKKSRKKLL